MAHGRKAARVACVGISVLDYILDVDRLPEARIKHYATGRREVTGGIAANAARAVARLGGDAALVSRVGDDLPGRTIRAELSAEGIDVGGVTVLPGARTSLSAVIIDATGERMLVNDTDPSVLIGTEGMALSAFTGADAVLADTRWVDAAIVAMQRAAAAGVPGVLDFDRVPDPPRWEPLLDLASHVVFGRQGLAAFAGSDDIETGLALAHGRSSAWLAVTCGEEGVFWLDGKCVRHVPGFEVRTVDTLGAGDIFHAAFALALAERRPIATALRYSNAAAALKCSRPGGGAGAPRRAEVEQFLEERA